MLIQFSFNTRVRIDVGKLHLLSRFQVYVAKHYLFSSGVRREVDDIKFVLIASSNGYSNCYWGFWQMVIFFLMHQSLD